MSLALWDGHWSPTQAVSAQAVHAVTLLLMLVVPYRWRNLWSGASYCLLLRLGGWDPFPASLQKYSKVSAASGNQTTCCHSESRNPSIEIAFQLLSSILFAQAFPESWRLYGGISSNAAWVGSLRVLLVALKYCDNCQHTSCLSGSWCFTKTASIQKSIWIGKKESIECTSSMLIELKYWLEEFGAVRILIKVCFLQ